MPKQQEPEQAHECKTPYVYYSYEQWGRGYIGSRVKEGCYPGESYLGSYSDETFKPTDKVILFTGTAEECLAVEVKLHAFFDVVLSPHYANRARQTSAGFTTAGLVMSGEQKAKISATRKKGKKTWLEGCAAAAKKPRTQKQIDHMTAVGKMSKSGETRRRISEGMKGLRRSEETKRLMSEAQKRRRTREKETD